MKVNNNTRAGDMGREICCPKCTLSIWVYHFNWSALLCQYCKNEIKKTDWNLVLTVKDMKK